MAEIDWKAEPCATDCGWCGYGDDGKVRCDTANLRPRIDWKARHDDLAAAVAALADDADADGASWVDAHFVRAAVSDPAAVLAERDRRMEAKAWFAGYDKGNLDGYFGTSDERANSPYADLDPYREGQA